MNRHAQIHLLLLGATLAFSVFAQVPAGDAGLQDLDALTGRWMELRTTVAEEEGEWKARRDRWEDEIALLEHEAETLMQEIEEGEASTSSVEKRRSQALERQKRMEVELRKVRSVLARAEADLRRWRDRIPPGLRESTSTAFDLLPVTQQEADRLPLTRRAQTVVALYSQIETLQAGFHAGREILEADGNRRLADVLYVGLARAFAVLPTDDWAAVGVPSDAGWKWTPLPGAAAAVRQALDVLQRREPAGFVELPMQVAGEAQP